MASAKCEDCGRSFRKNEFTGDTCRHCRSARIEGDREAGAAAHMSVLVFGTNDPDKGGLMERVPVTSSNLKSIGYDADTETLQAEFKSGVIWDYEGVPAEKHAALMAAEADPEQSVGSLFHHSIKLLHKGTKVEQVQKEDAAA